MDILWATVVTGALLIVLGGVVLFFILDGGNIS